MLRLRVLAVVFVVVLISWSTSPAESFSPATTRVMQRRHRRATRPPQWRSNILIGAFNDSEGMVDEREVVEGGVNTNINEASGTANGSRVPSSTTMSGGSPVSVAKPIPNVQNSAAPPTSLPLSNKINNISSSSNDNNINNNINNNEPNDSARAALSAIAEAASQGVEIPDSESLTEIERAARNALGLNEKDALSGDFSAAFSMPVSPLPFTLPQLTGAQLSQLCKGERVQEQSDMGRQGKGFVVIDVKAPAKDVWDVLLDFESYPKTIPTVRKMTMFTNTHLKEPYYEEKPVQKEDFLNGKIAKLKYSIPSVTRAAFVLSKFRLNIAAIHKYRPHPGGHYMVFTLDPACTNVVLKSAKGVWHTQENPDGKVRIVLKRNSEFCNSDGTSGH
jgi:hypothetical protein